MEMRQVRDVIISIEAVLGIKKDATKAEVNEAARKRAKMVAVNAAIAGHDAFTTDAEKTSRRAAGRRRRRNSV